MHVLQKTNLNAFNTCDYVYMEALVYLQQSKNILPILDSICHSLRLNICAQNKITLISFPPILHISLPHSHILGLSFTLHRTVYIIFLFMHTLRECIILKIFDTLNVHVDRIRVWCHNRFNETLWCCCWWWLFFLYEKFTFRTEESALPWLLFLYLTYDISIICNAHILWVANIDPTLFEILIREKLILISILHIWTGGTYKYLI